MEEIRDLLVMVDGGSYTCGEIKARTIEHAKSIRGKINDLEKIETTLLSISARCKGGKIPACPIVDTLSSL
jgi:MerR family mercuric resistance operon transcriptional regulator